MKKLVSSLFLSLFVCSVAFCQDIITRRDGVDIAAKVLEVMPDLVKYQKADNLEGPVYGINISEIIMITYANGTRDMFLPKTQPANTDDAPIDQQPQYAEPEQAEEEYEEVLPEVTDRDYAIQGAEDGAMYYRGRNSGAGWTAATTILFSPLVGLIPAAACSSTRPSVANLDTPTPILMNHPYYAEAYISQAHKTKRRKVWTSYGVSSAIWLFLVVVL